MKEFKIGYFALSKASWATPEIESIRTGMLDSLGSLSCEVVHGDGLTTTAAEAETLCSAMNRSEVDAVIVHFATFPVGAIIPVIAKRMKVPIILFATPEEPQAGGMWAQNSFCGANMAVHTLRKLGRKYAFVFGSMDEAAELMKKPLATVRCLAELNSAKIGLVGGRVPGFYTSNCDEMRLRAAIGPEVEVIELLEIVDTAKKLSDDEVSKGLQVVNESSAQCCDSVQDDLEPAARLYQAMLKGVEKYGLTSYAVRCWPEWSDIFGIAPCAALGMLNNTGLVSSCEGDVLGAVLMQMQASLSGGGFPFFADLISFDCEENTAVLWHCGAAPSKICRKFEETTLNQHFRVDGGNKKGLTNEFSIKKGDVTLAQLDEDGDGYRMLIAKGTALDTEPFIRGNPLNVHFDCSVRDMMDTIMNEGFKHHYTMVHADIESELLELCRWLDIRPVIVGV
ncbi:MAG: L-fucose/L-arabinose isomerase family protein [Kiritimatiellia bacterium]